MQTLPPTRRWSAALRFSLFTLKSSGARTVTASDVSDGHKGGEHQLVYFGQCWHFVKLQLLAPGETGSPGTATGKTGTPTVQTAGTAFNVTVNAVDVNWNVVNTISDTVGLAFVRPQICPARNTALSAGTVALSVTFKTATASGWTLTATNSSDGTKTAYTSRHPGERRPFAKLQLLTPGEITAPGTSAGRPGHHRSNRRSPSLASPLMRRRELEHNQYE
jgi:hypothetical protein